MRKRRKIKMSESITVNMENLSKDERDILIKLIEKSNGSTNKHWIPTSGSDYYHINEVGMPCEDTRGSSDFTNSYYYRIGNYFKSKEDAEHIIERLKIHHELQVYADEHNDTKGLTTSYYYIVYQRDINTLQYHFWRDDVYANQVAFSSKAIAMEAAAKIGIERLIKYYFN